MNMNLSKDNYTDYEAKAFFADYGLNNVTFTSKEIKTSNGAKVKLVTVKAVNPQNGQRIDFDIWPNRCQTLDDLKAMPEKIGDIIIRFGKYQDEETGEVVEATKPRIIGYFQGKEEVFFHGPKPEWDDDAQASVWTNEPEKKEEAK